MINCVVCLTFEYFDPRAVSLLISLIGSMMSAMYFFLFDSFARFASPGVSIFSETALAREIASSIAAALAPGIIFR
ncbi:hypothetical protein ES703_84245 [subsurface metagenome]